MTIRDLLYVVVVSGMTQSIANIPALQFTKDLKKELQILNNRLYAITGSVTRLDTEVSTLKSTKRPCL